MPFGITLIGRSMPIRTRTSFASQCEQDVTTRAPDRPRRSTIAVSMRSDAFVGYVGMISSDGECRRTTVGNPSRWLTNAPSPPHSGISTTSKRPRTSSRRRAARLLAAFCRRFFAQCNPSRSAAGTSRSTMPTLRQRVTRTLPSR